MSILVTGGLGYIGSHTCLELLPMGCDVVVLDNLANSQLYTKTQLEEFTGRTVHFYEGDVRDGEILTRVFEEHRIDAVIHFAAMKAVGESAQLPLEYYDNNITGTLSLLKVMREHQCKTMVFSSSATVYGEPAEMPIGEDCPVGECTNPYGRTKQMAEQILRDVAAADPEWNVTLLRYFNPIGAHPGGIIGERPNGIPNNLMPYITQVAAGKLPHLNVFGDDYPTPDGTGVRDYIHVVDLAKAHVSALSVLRGCAGVHVYNLGTGRGYSVLEMVKTFEKVNGVQVPFVVQARRPGDVASCYCDPSKAARELGWKAEYTLEDMCRDAWKWEQSQAASTV